MHPCVIIPPCLCRWVPIWPCTLVRGNYHAYCHQEQQRWATPGRALVLPHAVANAWCYCWPAASIWNKEREQLSMNAASCSTPAATFMDTSLCSTSAIVLAWLPARTQGPPHLRGLPLPSPLSHTCLWNTYNVKHLLQHTSKIDKTFTTYACNICVWALQYMQRLDKTLITYV
jgi:hypothetical protein